MGVIESIRVLMWAPLAEPTAAPGVIAASRRGCEEPGRPPGEVIVQGRASVVVADIRHDAGVPPRLRGGD